MAEQLTGVVALWGIDGFTVTGVVITDGKIQNYDLTRDSDKEMLTDESGEVVGEAYYNKKKTINITVIPVHATTVAGAAGVGDNLMPAAGTIVTFTSTADASPAALDSENSGKFIVQSARMNKTNRSFASIDLSLIQYDANDVAVQVP